MKLLRPVQTIQSTDPCSRPSLFMWDLWFGKLRNTDCMRSNQSVSPSFRYPKRTTWTARHETLHGNAIAKMCNSMKANRGYPHVMQVPGMPSACKIARMIQFLKWKCMVDEVLLKVRAHLHTNTRTVCACALCLRCMPVLRPGTPMSVLGTARGRLPWVWLYVCNFTSRASYLWFSPYIWFGIGLSEISSGVVLHKASQALGKCLIIYWASPSEF
jgi:hypothetical protein